MDFFIGVTPPDDITQRIVRFQTTFSNKFVVEPHITIKAQSGLTADRAWLKPVEICLRQQTPFRVGLMGPRWFGDDVLYLGVRSPGIHKIHDDLVRLINPSAELRHKYFEDVAFVPHLTLAETRFTSIAKETLPSMEARAKHELTDLPPFEVTFARIFQQANPNEPYTTLLDVPFQK
jgi:2'-5' RNA ligase